MQPVVDAIRYFTNQKNLMNYAQALSLGLPIGSGSVEATAKTVVTHRMKRAGSRWKMHTGQNILQLRGLATSDRWDAASDWHVAYFEATQPGVQDVA